MNLCIFRLLIFVRLSDQCCTTWLFLDIPFWRISYTKGGTHDNTEIAIFVDRTGCLVCWQLRFKSWFEVWSKEEFLKLSIFNMMRMCSCTLRLRRALRYFNNYFTSDFTTSITVIISYNLNLKPFNVGVAEKVLNQKFRPFHNPLQCVDVLAEWY